MRGYIETEDSLASLERIEMTIEGEHYEEEKENHFLSAHGKPPTPAASVGWPSLGRIEFKDLNLRFEPKSAIVVKNLNLVIEEGRKVGIFGKAGSGKSTLLSVRLGFL